MSDTNSKSEIVVIEGLAYWAKVFESNRDLEGFQGDLKDVGGQTTIDVDIDMAEWSKLKAAGSAQGRSLRPSADNDGMFRVKLKRRWQSSLRGLGGEPKVWTADGKSWDVDEMGGIGNGSKVTVAVQVYETSYGNKGTRLMEVRVDDHIPYEGPMGSSSSANKSVFGYTDTPSDTPEEPKQEAPKQPELEDDIPF